MKSNQNNEACLVDARLLNALKRCTNLPTPPGVAIRIMDLAQDPTVNIEGVASVISNDPALAAKILRITNSPLYAQRRKPENLRQAVILLGLNGTLTLALSFSLATALKKQNGEGMDYELYWKRSLAAATCCRKLATALKLGDAEEFFLAALLQDIGMLALDRVFPDLYKTEGLDQSHHKCLLNMEREILGTDHAAVGGWLLQQWGLPERLQLAVKGSHDPGVIADGGDKDLLSFVRCISLSGPTIDMARSDAGQADFQAVAKLAVERLGVESQTFKSIIETLDEDLREAGELFEIDLGDYNLAESLLDQAKETLLFRNLQTLQHTSKLEATTDELISKTRTLEEENKIDALTGVFNRAYFDQAIEEEFAVAKGHNWPIAVMFVDLDHFKRVNDTYGHQAGDEVLKGTGKILRASIRNSDIAVRYGGEEFVLILPGSNRSGAVAVALRMLKAFNNTRHSLDAGKEISITASIGLAVQEGSVDFAEPSEFIRAADEAVYQAKHQGRNCIVVYGSEADPIVAAR
ncbi:MAG: GGDEF domain-containing protein [Pseudomonadota bacterium]